MVGLTADWYHQWAESSAWWLPRQWEDYMRSMDSGAWKEGESSKPQGTGRARVEAEVIPPHQLPIGTNDQSNIG
ncbi:unnamed protein product [Soboliphyme baturini]|uniref:Uncharacterized protein n=1 Tax=Soboliphyme baturini TaxID=241478 RepID=A0A183ITD1_9BILA|nr:unnamed protein product [Soboliphyme baturini]